MTELELENIESLNIKLQDPGAICDHQNWAVAQIAGKITTWFDIVVTQVEKPDKVEKPGTFFPVGNKYNFIQKLYNLELSSEVG